jgi:Zinc finger, C2H2 type
MRTHTGERPYACQHVGCTKAFSQLSNLQSHMRSHMTDQPFRCHSCYKCFSNEAALREHIPRHNETKHLKTKICSVCGKSYAQETYLARHMARHQAITACGGGGFSNGNEHVPPETVHCTNISNMISLPSAFDHQFDNGLQLPVYRLIGDNHQSVSQPPQPSNSAFSSLFGLANYNIEHRV